MKGVTVGGRALGLFSLVIFANGGCSSASSKPAGTGGLTSFGGNDAQATGGSLSLGGATSGVGGSSTGGIAGATSTKLVIRTLTAGTDFACAALSDGTVHCWGDGFKGQLGNGVQNQSPVPTSVSNVANATSVSAGTSHACILLRDGSSLAGAQMARANWATAKCQTAARLPSKFQMLLMSPQFLRERPSRAR